MKAIALALGFLWTAGAVGAAPGAPTPALQRFRQEVAGRFPGDSQAPKGPVTLVLPGANGSVRAYSQGSWYEHQKGHWQTLPLGPSPPGNQFLFPDALGRAVSADFPGSSVIQVLPIGQGFLVVSTNRLHRWESGKWTREPWPESCSCYLAQFSQVTTEPV